MNQVFEINVDKSQMIYVLVFILLPDCSRGYFGEECAGKCSDKCYGCNNINGVCDSGCRPGWRGDYCHEGLICNLLCIINNFGLWMLVFCF